jgi:tetratricopeptide (TPR) repeat protein
MVIKINANVAKMVADQDYLGAIKIYESLGASLKSIKKTTKTSWSLGQAYRLLGQAELAIPFYKSASKRLKNGSNRFRAIFWHAVTLNDTIDAKTGAGSNTAEITNMKKDLARTNTKMMQSWRELKPDERQKLLVSMKSPFEKLLKSQALISSPVEILLGAWKNSLTTKAGDTTSKIEALKNSYAATGEAVEILIMIAEKFKRLGDKNKVNQARFLLSKLDPKSFDKEKDTENLWAKNLVALAETYRESNQYLDAGRIYALTGSKSENYEGRAEALYKGGLLLYHAGRREEALKAFNQASQDGNNLLYSELARKRLDQLNQ